MQITINENYLITGGVADYPVTRFAVEMRNDIKYIVRYTQAYIESINGQGQIAGWNGQGWIETGAWLCPDDVIDQTSFIAEIGKIEVV